MSVCRNGGMSAIVDIITEATRKTSARPVTKVRSPKIRGSKKGSGVVSACTTNR